MSVAFTDRLTQRWVRAYTRQLPASVREARRAEVDSDLWEHRDDTRARGLSSTLSALEVTGRLLAGVPADLAWRHAHLRAAPGSRRIARMERTLGTETMTAAKLGYPTWLTVLAKLMGGCAAILGLTSSVEYLFNRDEPSTFTYRLLLFVVGVALFVALWLLRRAQLVSVVLLAVGGVAFGVLLYWMVLPILAGIAVAIGAVLFAPRVLEPASSCSDQPLRRVATRHRPRS